MPGAVGPLWQALSLLSASPQSTGPAALPGSQEKLEIWSFVRNSSNTGKAKQNSSVGGHGAQPTGLRTPPCTMRTLKLRSGVTAGARQGLNRLPSPSALGVSHHTPGCGASLLPRGSGCVASPRQSGQPQGQPFSCQPPNNSAQAWAYCSLAAGDTYRAPGPRLPDPTGLPVTAPCASHNQHTGMTVGSTRCSRRQRRAAPRGAEMESP